MQRPPHNALLIILASLCLACPTAWAETGILVVHVTDIQRRPVAGLEIGVEREDGSAITDENGEARIRLAPRTKEKSSVSLQIVRFPSGQDLVMVSPWDSWTQVPSFENESDNFAQVLVVQRGDRAALQSDKVLKSAVSRINKANAPWSADNQSGPENLKALETVAKQFGISPDDLDQAIKAWGARTTDPYDRGLAALYAKNYDEATKDLQVSLNRRGESLASDQSTVADTTFFLGQSLYEQAKFQESAVAYQRCLQTRSGDTAVLRIAAASLIEAGDYPGAEPLSRRALTIDEKALGPEDTQVATDLNVLGRLFYAKGDYPQAEPLYRRALAIDEKALGPDHPGVTMDLNNLAELLNDRGDYAGAEPLYRRTLAIREKTLGSDHPQVATSLSLLGGLLSTTGDYAQAEPLLRRALAIREKALRPDDPNVAASLHSLGMLLMNKRDYAAAEPLYRRALALDEKVLGPNHPYVAADLNSLGLLLKMTGDYAGAEPLYRRALAISEKALGPDHPDVGGSLINLGELLRAMGDYAGAESLYRRALAIEEKALGPDHPNVAASLNNLAKVLEAKGDYAGAELLFRRAVAIDEKALGPDHPTTRIIKNNLDQLLR